jgi:hypothetical protein
MRRRASSSRASDVLWCRREETPFAFLQPPKSASVIQTKTRRGAFRLGERLIEVLISNTWVARPTNPPRSADRAVQLDGFEVGGQQAAVRAYRFENGRAAGGGDSSGRAVQLAAIGGTSKLPFELGGGLKL